MSSGIGFGKILTEESYFNGRIKSTKVSYQVPELVNDKAGALSEIMKSLDLVSNKQTATLNIKVEADPKNHQFKLVTTSYVVEKK